MQSDELEELSSLIEKSSIPISQAVELIADFAQSKIKLDLSGDVLFDKISAVYESIDHEELKQLVLEIQGIDAQMKEIDNRIKIISNRCQNELAPRLKAVSDFADINTEQLIKSESQIAEEMTRI